MIPISSEINACVCDILEICGSQRPKRRRPPQFVAGSGYPRDSGAQACRPASGGMVVPKHIL